MTGIRCNVKELQFLGLNLAAGLQALYKALSEAILKNLEYIGESQGIFTYGEI